MHNLLSDANVDWGQQLYQVKQWQDRHPAQECWFAYFARPEIDPGVYGIHCHALPTADTQWLGGAELIPSKITGAILISAGDLSGCEEPSGHVNPYRSFQALHPDLTIDNSIFVYEGTFAVPEIASVSRAQQSLLLLTAKQPEQAVTLAHEAVAIAPDNLFSETVLGDAASAIGDKQMARAAWQAAIQIAQRLEPGERASYIPDLQSDIKRLSID